MQWSIFRAQIRRTVLNDADKTSWTDDTVLLDAVNWALVEFCAHTAYQALTMYDSPAYDLQQTTFPVPTNLFDNLETTALIYTANGNQKRVYQSPLADLKSGNTTFEVWGGQIFLSEAPESTLYIRHFANYPAIAADTDMLAIPQWAFPAIAYLVGVHAFSSLATQSANISQWKEAPEKGNPEQNALRAHQKWLLEMYEREIARHSPQRRNHYHTKR